MDNRFSALLNFFRWMAAFLVVTGHLRNIVFVDYEAVQHKTVFVKSFYLITGLGHEAVMVFFVISGLLVGGLSFSKWRSKKMDYASYFMNRISRIYVVLLPALIVGGMLDFIGLHFFNQSGLYTNTANFPAALNFAVQEQLTAQSLLGSAVMLQPFVVPSFGSNAPLWSLSYEWWYYCIFAAFLAFFSSKTSWAGKIILAAAAVGFGALLPLVLIVWMSIWLLGTGVHWYGESRFPKPHPVLTVSFFIAVIISSKMFMKMGGGDVAQEQFIAFGKDLLTGIGFSVLLLSFYRRTEKQSVEHQGRPLQIRINRLLAEFSYTTYLCHFPFMLLFLTVSADVFNQALKQQPGIETSIYFVFVLACTYLYAFIFSRLTERHTSDVRKRLANVFALRPHSAVSVK